MPLNAFRNTQSPFQNALNQFQAFGQQQQAMRRQDEQLAQQQAQQQAAIDLAQQHSAEDQAIAAKQFQAGIDAKKELASQALKTAEAKKNAKIQANFASLSAQNTDGKFTQEQLMAFARGGKTTLPAKSLGKQIGEGFANINLTQANTAELKDIVKAIAPKQAALDTINSIQDVGLDANGVPKTNLVGIAADTEQFLAKADTQFKDFKRFVLKNSSSEEVPKGETWTPSKWFRPDASSLDNLKVKLAYQLVKAVDPKISDKDFENTLRRLGGNDIGTLMNNVELEKKDIIRQLNRTNKRRSELTGKDFPQIEFKPRANLQPQQGGVDAKRARLAELRAKAAGGR